MVVKFRCVSNGTIKLCSLLIELLPPDQTITTDRYSKLRRPH